MEEILIPLGLFGMITAIVIYVAFVKYRERMEMIRKGPMNFLETPSRVGSKTLLVGLFSIATGLACFSAAFINYFERNLLFSVGIFWLFVGVALIAYWRATAGDREQTCTWYERLLSSKTHNTGQLES